MTKRRLAWAIFPILLIFAGWGIFFLLRNFWGVYPAVFVSSRKAAALFHQGKALLSYPDEFELSLFAEGLTGPRVIAFDPRGTMLVSMTAAGKVVALPDADKDGRADRVVVIAGDLNRPHGIAFSPTDTPRLYIAETDRVMAYPYDQKKLQVGQPELITYLPGGGHYTRTLLFMPPPDENRLLISVGSSCNSCKETDWRRAKILSIATDNHELQPFASGLRNTVFMTIHPGTQDIWATEMGRDNLGDDLPPDEINIIRQGRDYGWPSCYGKNVPDTEYLDTDEIAGACSGKTPSFIDIQAHSAPLGLDFFPTQGDWPEKYRGNLLVAYHGSWNRTVPTGYKIVLFRFDERGNLLGREDFVSGWLRDSGASIGRPVDVRIRKGGLIYISDDKAGVIYQLALKQKNRK